MRNFKEMSGSERLTYERAEVALEFSGIQRKLKLERNKHDVSRSSSRKLPMNLDTDGKKASGAREPSEPRLP